LSHQTAAAGKSQEINAAASPTEAPAGFMAELAAGLAAAQITADGGTLSTYSIDQGPVVDWQLPLAVVWAESVADVQHIARTCTKYGVPIVPRGAGTGVSGGAHAVKGCIVLSLERMNRILELNPDHAAVTSHLVPRPQRCVH